MSAIHHLKTWPEYYSAVESGVKLFEIRKNDRHYQVGDTLILQEWIPGVDPECDVHQYNEEGGQCSCNSFGTLTGRSIQVVVTYKTDFKQRPGYIVLGIKPQ